ncbi:MAG: TPM domain-containing protein [Lachnospiraceae bacterium]|nr:TPM domain-containing protein [Lachnospiraceae bacterium]
MRVKGCDQQRRKGMTGVRALLAGFVLTGLMLLQVPLTVYAAPPLLVDEADLLSDSEEQELSALLEDVGGRHGIEIAIYIAERLDGKSAQLFSDDVFVYELEMNDGVLFFQCPEERDYAFTSDGIADSALSDDALDDIEQAMLSYLREDDYMGAYRTFAEGVDRYMSYFEKNGVSFSYADLETHEEDQQYLLNPPEEERTFFEKILDRAKGNAILAPIAGVLGGFVYSGSKKRKLVSVRRQSGASGYVRAGESRMRVSRDILVNRTVNRTPIVRNENRSSGGRIGGTSTHHVHSSSGRTLGGRSGKY